MNPTSSQITKIKSKIQYNTQIPTNTMFNVSTLQNFAIKLIKGRKSKIVDSIKLKVAAKMEDVTVKIENDIREIAALEVRF